MFFVSEEFLRKYEIDEEVNQTIDEAVSPGEELFGDVGGKRKHNVGRRKKQQNKDR